MSFNLSSLFRLFNKQPQTVDLPKPDNPAMLGVEAGYQSLRDTVAWTNHLLAGITDFAAVDNGRVLRSVNPVYKGVPLYTFGENDIMCALNEDVSYKAVLDELMPARRGFPLTNVKGRILLMALDSSLWEGAMFHESKGLIDSNDMPPVDTWFMVTKEHLYFWMPAPFLYYMTEAMALDTAGSYSWLEDAAPRLNKQLMYRLEEEMNKL